MTEPVAYLNKYLDNSTNITRHKPIDKSSILPSNNRVSSTPLYTPEDLHTRVKMTKKQHKQFENYKTNKNDFYDFWQSLLVDDVSLFKEISERNLMLAWLDDRTIEIVPDMKWFVRSKESEINGYGWLSIIDKYQTPIYQYSENRPFGNAVCFDTKEEAELWTNPLTEAVQLPVEGE